jgi:hypothetical protein
MPGVKMFECGAPPNVHVPPGGRPACISMGGPPHAEKSMFDPGDGASLTVTHNTELALEQGGAAATV